MQLLGLEIMLPAGLRWDKASSAGDGTCTELVGEGAATAVSDIVDAAVRSGFSVSRRDEDRVELERDEQRLILLYDSSGLTIQTYDPTLLPSARHDGSAVMLADLRVDLGRVRITPLRERRMGELRQAAWKLSGAAAPDVVRRVIDVAVAEKRLRRGAAFGPANQGNEVWTAEASSDVELVKARATVMPDHVLLEVDLVNRGSKDEA